MSRNIATIKIKKLPMGMVSIEEMSGFLTKRQIKKRYGGFVSREYENKPIKMYRGSFFNVLKICRTNRFHVVNTTTRVRKGDIISIDAYNEIVEGCRSAGNYLAKLVCVANGINGNGSSKTIEI